MKYLIPIIFTTVACGQPQQATTQAVDVEIEEIDDVPTSDISHSSVAETTCLSVPNVVVYIKDCKYGGVTVLTGLDVNGNGVLDDGDD